jgi:hypothetical protein
MRIRWHERPVRHAASLDTFRFQRPSTPSLSRPVPSNRLAGPVSERTRNGDAPTPLSDREISCLLGPKNRSIDS